MKNKAAVIVRAMARPRKLDIAPALLLAIAIALIALREACFYYISSLKG